MNFLYVDPALRYGGILRDARLLDFTERHHFRLPPVELGEIGAIEPRLDDEATQGIVFALASGLPGGRVLKIARYALRRRKAAFLYWPNEDAIEVLDRERIGSLNRHRLAFVIGTRLLEWRRRRGQRAAGTTAATAVPAAALAVDLTPVEDAVKFIIADFASTKAHLVGGIGEIRRLSALLAAHRDALRNHTERLTPETLDAIVAELSQVVNEAGGIDQVATQLVSYMDGGEVALARIETNLDQLATTLEGLRTPAASSAPAAATVASEPLAEGYDRDLRAFALTVAPVRMFAINGAPSPQNKIPGTGVYVRTDYWSQLISGGSYGHTCYVAKELSRVTDDFVCLFGSRYPLLDDLGIAQEVVRPTLTSSSETDLLMANGYYYEAIRERLGKLRPSYIYERLVLGNYAAARLSRELQIPYILEYNGSEISMRHSFGSGAMAFEEQFLEAERVAFAQATVITAISEHVRDDIVRRGIPSEKIVVNPNGVDCDEYAPGAPAERAELRASLGFAPEHRVLGFIGTFGGWHGIDVMAAAMPEICRRAPLARFLLIGDGNLKHLVTAAVAEHGLQDRVVDLGRTDQRAGARYLRAADIYLSPHSSHMVDSKFFGSPTKLFEYMALGGGIVASDLEQIGITLAPALRPADFAGGKPAVGAERAVLCRPGDLGDFVAGVLALVQHADVSAALGANARAAAVEHFSWERHVARIFDHALGLKRERAWH